MNNPLVVVALLLAVGAAGVAGYAATREPAAGGDVDARLLAVEDQLSRVEAELGALRAASRPPPSLMGLSPTAEDPAVGAAQRAAAEAAAAATQEPLVIEEGAKAEALRELVNEAVEKKAAQMRAMREKKPSLDSFAAVLELDEAQREKVARDVVASQQEIRTLLEIPAEDGTVFLDELVDILAGGIAQPGSGKERGAALFGRLMSEKVPGTDETYAAQAEAVKARLRTSFQRDFSTTQYATFEAWRMDPTEIKDIPGSPWKDLEGRVLERARALGAKLPGDDGPK
ncbi:MAG: hypothetical protein P1V36_18055 [Planctomycetota bacterium]|nr:hypothetical protein [Planctomycetota bacterium]